MSKYFKYALGETLLVVVGILIALGINNWNENRKDRNSEFKVLVDLQSEFSSNLIVFDSILELKNNIRQEQERIIEAISNFSNTDSLMPNGRARTGALTFDPSQSVVNSVLQNGKIDLIENDSLKYLLTNWQDLLIDYKEDEQWHTNFTQRELYAYETKNIPGHFYKYHPKDGHRSPFYSKSEIRSFFHKAFKDQEYRNLLLRNLQYLTMTTDEGDRLMQAMKHINKSLSEEIEDRRE